MRLHRDQRGQSLVIVLSLITILFLLGSSLAVHASVALRSTRTSAGQGNDFYAADAATELGIWWQRNGKAGNPPAQTINGITTSTTITTAGGGGGSCPAAPSVAWMNGFESGVIYRTNGSWSTNLVGGFTSVASGASGVVDAVSSPARTGNYSMRVAPTSWASNYAYLSAPYGPVLGPTVVAHFAIRMGALPTADAPVFTIMNTASNGWQHGNLFLYYRPITGKWALGLSLGLTPTLYQESSVTAVAGTWYSFDIRMQMTGTDTRMAEWYLDGVAQPTVSAVDSPGSGSGTIVVLGQWGTSTFGGAYTAYYDDVVLSTTPSDYPIGDMNISPLRPDAVGSNVNPSYFTQRTGAGPDANSWLLFDDSPMNSNTDFLRQVTASATSYIELTFQDTTQTCIRGVAPEMDAHPEGTSANNTKTSFFDGATEYVLYQGDISFATTGLAFAIRPITSGAWTQARVNGLKVRFGYGVDINPIVAWDDFDIQVAWTTVAGGPATVTIVGTGGGSTVSTSYTDAGAGVPSLTTWTTTK
jgi:Tfp pilus assembly protein PilX